VQSADEFYVNKVSPDQQSEDRAELPFPIVIRHEFGHSLGLTDLKETDLKFSDADRYSIMAVPIPEFRSRRKTNDKNFRPFDFPEMPTRGDAGFLRLLYGLRNHRSANTEDEKR